MAIIQIAAKNVDGLGIAQHLYIVYTNDAGEQRVLRGGPENSNLQGTLMGNIQVVDQDYRLSLDYDNSGNHPTRTIWSGTDTEMAVKISSARTQMDYINGEGFDYNLPLIETVLPTWPVHNNQNSNTVANVLAGTMGLGTEASQFVGDNHLNAPGFSATLEHSTVERTTLTLSQAIDDAGLSASEFVNRAAILVGDTVENVVEGSQELLRELVPALVPDAQGHSWGDPHLVTFDKSAYDFQVPGEHVLAKSTIDDFEIQVRTELMPGSTAIAYNTAVATSLNGTRVGLYLPPRIPGRQYGSLGDDRLQAA